MAKWLASTLPVADAVSFEFNGINVTAHHVMARSVPMMRLLAFYDQFIKDCRGCQVPAQKCIYERTGEREVGYKRLMTVCRSSLLWNSAIDDIDGGISTADAASS